MRASIAASTVNSPKGSINGPRQNLTVYANDQVLDAATWQNLVVGYHNSAAVRIKDIGSAEKGHREQPDRRLGLSGQGQSRQDA